MNILVLVIVGILILIALGVFFRVVHFALKLGALTLLLGLIVFCIYFLLQTSTDVLYLVEKNESVAGFGLDGRTYEFSTLNSTDFNQTYNSYSTVYVINYVDFSRYCSLNVSSVVTCFTKDSVKALMHKVK